TGKRGLTSLYLEPLTPLAMDSLLRGMVPGISSDMLAAIRDRAAGIPLYAVETVRMLLDRGVLVEREGVYVTQGALDVTAVPDSLQALIAARLDSLSTAERALIQDASVLGKSFSPAALSTVSGFTLPEIESALGTLVSKDLLSIQSDPRSPERGQYVFVQDVVRSVAYGTLPKRERKQKHLAAAEYLSESWPESDDVSEVVASHLVDAVEADPSAEDAPQLRRRAREALVLAGEHAAALAANAAALGYFEKALALADGDATRAELHGKVARMAARQARFDLSRQHFGHAIDLHRSLGDTIALAELLIDRAVAADYRDGRLSDALAAADEAYSLITSLDAGDEKVERAMAYISGRLAKLVYFQGEDLERALALAERALAVAEAAGLAEIFAIGLDAKASVLAARGRRREAQLLYRGGVDEATANNLTDMLPLLLGNLATTEEEDDALEAAIDHYAQMEQVGIRAGERAMEEWGIVNRAPSLLELGRWQECQRIADRFHQRSGGSEAAILPLAVYCLALYYVRTGQIQQAENQVRSATELADELNVEARMGCASALAAVLNANGSAKDALQLAQDALRTSLEYSLPVMARQSLIEAVDAAFQVGDDRKVEELIALFRQHHRAGRQPSIDAHEQRWRGRLATHRGEAAAEQHYREAAARFAELRRPFWLAVTRVEHAEWLTAQGRSDQASQLIDEARSTFEELGARLWLERADRARRRSRVA
ncbi:MAG: hypothetical protein JOZ73_14560, partial [Solirubrobacterales bacterium]|nr:hypothetical protein [Solirubrobacterales bacterium]